jgi:hypothetical protein
VYNTKTINLLKLLVYKNKSRDSTILMFPQDTGLFINVWFACVFGCSQMTTLEDDVPRSEMLCMMAIPAAYTIHDLIQFTAPLK